MFSPFVVRLGLFDGFGRRTLLLLVQIFLQLLGPVQVVCTASLDALCASLALDLVCNNTTGSDHMAMSDRPERWQ